MPKFMKDQAILLIEGGIEAYLLGLYGLSFPSLRIRKRQESRFAPVMGLFGAASELLVKACLVQAKGSSAMYKDNQMSGVYKYGKDCIEELKKEIQDENPSVDFLWKDAEDKVQDKALLISHLSKFHLLQRMRADGLHAGSGCSRDIAVSAANDLYSFIQILSKAKKLKAYLRGMPAPEATIRDREAIIEDLSRRISGIKQDNNKIQALRSMYLVLPYIPDLKPDWLDCFDRIEIAPPTQDDVSYLLRTLEDAHSIYLLKSRGGKEGIPVRIEPQNPNALPIAIQNIKRTLSSIPDQFNNDVLTANTRLEQQRLDLPIDDFLVYLFAIGLVDSGILTDATYLTAQQSWPYIVSAYSVQGTPRPSWEFISKCNELDRLINYLEKAKSIGNGYYRRRADTVISFVRAFKDDHPFQLYGKHDDIFDHAMQFAKRLNSDDCLRPITPQLLRSIQLTNRTSLIAEQYLSNEISAGTAIEQILKANEVGLEDKRIVVALMRACIRYDQRNGVIAVLRSDYMKSYHSEARKQLFFIDWANSEVVAHSITE